MKTIEFNTGESVVLMDGKFGERAILFVDKIESISLKLNTIYFITNDNSYWAEFKDKETAEKRFVSLTNILSQGDI